MFKTLIATALLSTSVSVNAIKPKQVQPVQAINEVDDNYISVHGWYTFRQVINYSLAEGTTLSLDFDSDTNKMYCIVARSRDNFEYNLDVCTLKNLFLTRISGSDTGVNVGFQWAYTVNDNFGTYYYYVSGGTWVYDSFLTQTPFVIGNNDSKFVSSTDFFKNLMIYFEDTIILYGDSAVMFNAFFTGQGNSYTKFYNGWYTYNNNNWYNFDYCFEIPYNIYQVNNLIYTSYRHDFDNVYYKYIDGTYPYDHVFTVYAYTEYTRVRPVQIYGMIPYTAHECMALEGVFDYIQPQSDTTWYEMILSVMDAPIYYLSQLFNFELFGISMFVALTSLLTLALVVTIIKKVV